VIARNPTNGELVGLICAKTTADGWLVGAFSIDQLASTTLGASLPSNSERSILLVGADSQIIYHTGDLPDQSPDHPGIAPALQGQSGIVYVKVGGDEHVTAYSPVSAAGWGLVTEESWLALSTPTLRASQITPLVLVPVVLIMLIALWFGLSQVVRPLQALEAQTATLAAGDFQSIRQPVGGISEVRRLQDELIQMADKVDEAQRSLHGYIGAITEAQEDERQRLARELHDDTLQALIALKQRVQLAQLEQAPAMVSTRPNIAELDENVTLTEQTIENLRRLTRAMRQAYLEDLGLIPALEVLAREAGQGMGFKVEYKHMGNEIRLDASKELALYRIAQEALSNISRHAQAKRASLSISYLPDSVRLQVEDDGVGFNLPGNLTEYTAKGHYGLLGMHERAELVGAVLQIRSTPDKGTSLTVTMPVEADNSREKGV
jgi:signal transduction histidine kinase